MTADSHLNHDPVRALASADTCVRLGTDRIEAGAGTSEHLEAAIKLESRTWPKELRESCTRTQRWIQERKS